MATLNCRGFGRKADLIFDRKRTTYNIVFFQETLICDESHIKSLACRWSGPSYRSLAIGKQGSVCALIHGLKRMRPLRIIFFPLEKKRGADRWISALIGEDGSIVSFSDDLFHSLSSFYSSLLKSSPTDPVAQQELLSNISSTLPPDQALE